jgi:hypothetical protein
LKITARTKNSSEALTTLLKQNSSIIPIFKTMDQEQVWLLFLQVFFLFDPHLGHLNSVCLRNQFKSVSCSFMWCVSCSFNWREFRKTISIHCFLPTHTQDSPHSVFPNVFPLTNHSCFPKKEPNSRCQLLEQARACLEEFLALVYGRRPIYI